jgi:hypothetical protein
VVYLSSALQLSSTLSSRPSTHAARGWQAPNLVSRVVDGEGHEEKSWQRRLPVALETLLAK